MDQPAVAQQFHHQGFLVLPQFATAPFCEEVITLAQQHLTQQTGPMEYEADTAYPGAPESRSAEGGHTVRRLLQAYARDPLLANWATTPALVQILQQLLGPQVLLTQAHHNCIMTKQPRYSTATSWHRDSRYWHFQRAELVSSWLALRNETPENGCLLVIPGSHRMNIQPEQFDQRQFLRTDLAQNEGLLGQAQTVPLRQGDLLLFHSNLFHAAGRNQTDNTKFSLVFAWRAQNNPPEVGTRSASLPEIVLGAAGKS
jgi:phytanoyl-CoA hydroxylase